MAEKPVPARELTHLHVRIHSDVGELRSRWGRWAGARPGASVRAATHPEDIINVAFRTFRAVRLLQDALGGAQSPAVGLLAMLRRVRRRRP